jgi:hypothetical protein
MSISNAAVKLLAHLRRTVTRTLRRIAVASVTLTISLPPFVKLEIKTEPAKPKRRR